MSLNTESGFYVRKGCLHNISGEFHYKDLHPKVERKSKKMAKKLEWFVLVFGSTLDETIHAHRDSRATTTTKNTWR
jgi:hypothetical protein